MTTGSAWWFGTFFLTFHIFGIIIPTDLYFSGGLKPPTRDATGISGTYLFFFDSAR
jgi:hypothetical protein